MPAAYRADTDIDIPDRLEKFGHTHTCIAGPEPLAALEGKDQLQVLALIAVIQEPVIADLLKS